MGELDRFAQASPKWINSAGETVIGVNLYGARKVVLYDSDNEELFSDNNPANVWINDGPNCDSFMRLRISDPATLFDAVMQYNNQPLFWQTITSGGATTTHASNQSSVDLTVSADSSWIIRQTYRYFRYQPGKSQMPLLTGVMGAKQTNIVRRVGYFDNQNGLFFEQDEDNFKFVRRTNATGTPTDVPINQADWNVDTMDGNGPSGIILNEENAQIFFMDFEWLGVGGVRAGFVIDNKLIYCHKIKNANVLQTVYMTTANLPLRYELRSVGAITATATMKQICSTVISEGGRETEIGLGHSVGNGATPISVTTRRPILSIRPKSAINSITNRSVLVPDHIDLFAQGSSAFYEIVINGTLTSATFSVDPGTNCAFEADINADAIVGGEVIETGYVPASNTTKSTITDVITKGLYLTRDYSGTGYNTFSIVVTSMTASATIVAGSITAREIY